eukprot:TRINITY_DN60635_c0_g1_i1.p1 TRINITY_DN60635_c0_g1~~TRINITY_DN60635_c0_g1_i1.p1  ORF type:complete len:874 (+),score=217.15 TRINITY_DN60635_c0_g1_i1:173-2623(+)
MWREKEQQRFFFTNASTGEMSWDHPLNDLLRELVNVARDLFTRSSSTAERKEKTSRLNDSWADEARREILKWSSAKDEYDDEYFYHRETKEVMWENPVQVMLPPFFLRRQFLSKLSEDKYSSLSATLNSQPLQTTTKAPDVAQASKEPFGSREAAGATAAAAEPAQEPAKPLNDADDDSYWSKYLTSAGIVSLPKDGALLDILKDAMTGLPLPAPWDMWRDRENQRFFFTNATTGETTWAHPLHNILQELAVAGRKTLSMPADSRALHLVKLDSLWQEEARDEILLWSSAFDEAEGAEYFYNVHTKEAMWEHPVEVLLPSFFLRRQFLAKLSPSKFAATLGSLYSTTAATTFSSRSTAPGTSAFASRATTSDTKARQVDPQFVDAYSSLGMNQVGGAYPSQASVPKEALQVDPQFAEDAKHSFSVAPRAVTTPERNANTKESADLEEGECWSKYLASKAFYAPGEEALAAALLGALDGAPLPAPWEMWGDKDSRTFYFENTATGDISWDHPMHSLIQELAVIGRESLSLSTATLSEHLTRLGSTWEAEFRSEIAKWRAARDATDDAEYFYHAETKEVMWEQPADILLPRLFLKRQFVEQLRLQRGLPSFPLAAPEATRQAPSAPAKPAVVVRAKATSAKKAVVVAAKAKASVRAVATVVPRNSKTTSAAVKVVARAASLPAEDGYAGQALKAHTSQGFAPPSVCTESPEGSAEPAPCAAPPSPSRRQPYAQEVQAAMAEAKRCLALFDEDRQQQLELMKRKRKSKKKHLPKEVQGALADAQQLLLAFDEERRQQLQLQKLQLERRKKRDANKSGTC